MVSIKKWGIIYKSLAIVLVLIVVRLIVDYLGWDTIPINPVVGAFITGAIFTIAIIFTGTFTDYKESEKISGEMCSALKALYNDTLVVPLGDEAPLADTRSHIRGLLHEILSSFQNNTWDIRAINRAMDTVNDDIRTLARLNVAPPQIVKLRVEMGTIDKLVNRVDVIIRTEFIPAAYAISEVATAGVILVLLFVKIDPAVDGILMFAVISIMLIGLIFLIKDMDNPFEFGEQTHADVDIQLLVDLETYFNERPGNQESGQNP
jgi:hypothetical protein